MTRPHAQAILRGFVEGIFFPRAACVQPPQAPTLLNQELPALVV